MPTHGSLTKAGKVRNQTPEVAQDEKKGSGGPIRRNRRKYLKMRANKGRYNRRGRRRRG